MSDDQNMSGMDPVPAPEAAPVVTAAPVRSAGSGARIWIVVGAVLVLAAVLGVVAYVVLTSQAIPSTSPATTLPVATTPGTGTGTGTTSGGAVTGTSTAGGSTATTLPTIPDVNNGDVFEPRDPFVVIEPPTVSTSTADTSDTTLSLTDIVTQDGVRKAVVSYKGKTYTVGVGDTVDSSSYKVLVVNSASVKFQFGDSTFTLALGQGTSK